MRPLFRRQTEILRNVPRFPGKIAENLLTVSNGFLKHANPKRTALINVIVHRIRGHKIKDGDAFAFLPVAVNASNPLFNAHGIPRQIVIDHAVAELIVQSLTANLRKKQNVQRVSMFSRKREAFAQGAALLIRDAAVNQSDTDSTRRQFLVKIAQRMEKTAEHHHAAFRPPASVP